MIELKDGVYHKAVMNFEFRKGTLSDTSGNVLAALYTTDPDKMSWTLVYRMRYYLDDKVNDSEDIKNWYKVEMLGEESEVFEKVKSMFYPMAFIAQSKLNIVLIESDQVSVQIERIKELPGINMTTVDPKDLPN